MLRKLSICVSEWVWNDILADKKNVSRYIEEVLIKHKMQELKSMFKSSMFKSSKQQEKK